MILKIIDIFVDFYFYRRDKKKFSKLENSLNFNKPCNNINTIHYDDLISRKELNLEDANDDECRKIGRLEKLEKLESPGEYLNMIRPDLRDWINRHKPTEVK